MGENYVNALEGVDYWLMGIGGLHLMIINRTSKHSERE